MQSSLDELAALGELGGEVLSELLELLKGCRHRVSLVVGRRARRSYERAARAGAGEVLPLTSKEPEPAVRHDQ